MHTGVVQRFELVRLEPHYRWGDLSVQPVAFTETAQTWAPARLKLSMAEDLSLSEAEVRDLAGWLLYQSDTLQSLNEPG